MRIVLLITMWILWISPYSYGITEIADCMKEEGQVSDDAANLSEVIGLGGMMLMGLYGPQLARGAAAAEERHEKEQAEKRAAATPMPTPTPPPLDQETIDRRQAARDALRDELVAQRQMGEGYDLFPIAVDDVVGCAQPLVREERIFVPVHPNADQLNAQLMEELDTLTLNAGERGLNHDPQVVFAVGTIVRNIADTDRFLRTDGERDELHMDHNTWLSTDGGMNFDDYSDERRGSDLQVAYLDAEARLHEVEEADEEYDVYALAFQEYDRAHRAYSDWLNKPRTDTRPCTLAKSRKATKATDDGAGADYEDDPDLWEEDWVDEDDGDRDLHVMKDYHPDEDDRYYDANDYSLNHVEEETPQENFEGNYEDYVF